MSTFSSESLRITQRARHVAVMMMVPMRPEMIQNAHLLSQRLTKRAVNVNLCPAPKNRYDRRVFWMLPEIDPSATFIVYLVEVRIPSLAGRAFPISFGARCERGKVVDPPKSLGELNNPGGWGPGLRPDHCHPL